MVLFKINSKTLSKNPTSINQSKYKLQNTDRTIDGTLVADIIAIKNKVILTWDYLTSADLKKLIDEINGDSFPIVEYADPETNELYQITGHCDDISYTPHYDNSKEVIIWKDVKVSFEERWLK